MKNLSLEQKIAKLEKELVLESAQKAELKLQVYWLTQRLDTANKQIKQLTHEKAKQCG